MGELINLNSAAPITDADIPASIARDTEFAAADADHVAAADPHNRFKKDVVTRIATGINWTANNWYLVPGLIIPFVHGEIYSYVLSLNYQYGEWSHHQIGGYCFLPGGIGWKFAGIRLEVVMQVQHHWGADNIVTFRSAPNTSVEITGENKQIEIKPGFDIVVNGSSSFIEFAVKRF